MNSVKRHQQISHNYWSATYGQLKFVVTYDGYFNATKLCSDIGIDYYQWKYETIKCDLPNTSILVNGKPPSYNGPPYLVTVEDRDDNIVEELSGMYVHPNYLPSLARLLAPSYTSTWDINHL